jgi:Ca2+-binding RTX toxin-like protein
LGFGFVDAHGAVRLAETWERQQNAANRDTVGKTVTTDQQIVAGETDHISVDIKLSQAILAEHVQLTTDLKWRNTGDLDVYLTSPEGTTVRLVYDLPAEGKIGSFETFAFTSVASLGEMAAGTWRLDIHNRDADANIKGNPMKGQLGEVTLTVHGRSDGLADDLYVYNDDFATIGAAEAARRKLDDTDGGTDGINAAMVTFDTRIDLSGATTSKIAGVTVQIAGGRIENAWTGDGDDVLIGDGGANRLHGGRGDDAIHFSGGADELIGGAGTDSLIFDMASGAVRGVVESATALSLGLVGAVRSLVSEIERFVFTDATYSLSQMAALLEKGGSAVPPVSGPPVEEAPTSGKSTSEDTAAEEKPVVERPADLKVLTGTKDADKLLGGGAGDLIEGYGGDDIISGRSGDDYLHGGWGDDSLRGGAGDDTIEGGAGIDTMSGGAGADTFVFDIAHIGETDLIRGFNPEEGDRILLTGLGATETFGFEVVGTGRIRDLMVELDDGVHLMAQIVSRDFDELSLQHLSAETAMLT